MNSTIKQLLEAPDASRPFAISASSAFRVVTPKSSRAGAAVLHTKAASSPSTTPSPVLTETLPSTETRSQSSNTAPSPVRESIPVSTLSPTQALQLNFGLTPAITLSGNRNSSPKNESHKRVGEALSNGQLSKKKKKKRNRLKIQ